MNILRCDDKIEHINNDEINIGCKFSPNYHYRVIDIKWSQLQLCSDGFKILNSDRYPAYKGQLAIYNLALGKIQNYIPNNAYILGKSYIYYRIYTFINPKNIGILWETANWMRSAIPKQLPGYKNSKWKQKK